MSLTAFPEPKDLDVPFVDRIGDSRPKTFQQYDVSNPHPGFGKDPNILNEFGHTKYPMWVDSKIEGKRVVVNNPMEEMQHTQLQPTDIPVIEPVEPPAVDLVDTPKQAW